MKRYYRFVYDTIAETEKAFALDYVVGYAKRKPIWVPKAICGFEEENDVGNAFVTIPEWFFRKNFYDYKNVDARFLGIVQI